MSDADLDLEALFDEISASSQAGSATASAPPAAATASPSAVTAAAGDPADEQADKQMYVRLGGIVRMLHDSMRELGYDRSLSEVASQIGDAQGRLEFVATLTEQAANKVLNALDVGMPAQDVLSKGAKDIGERWSRLFAGQMNIEEFKKLAHDSRAFAATAFDSAEAEKARMLEIMMAQDFQDITGQLIKKIVGITAIAERELAQLLRDNAPPELLNTANEAKDKPVELMAGPAADGSALVQNDVDDLLDSLGF
ncbi:MAG: chemotaxis protein CheZ [Herbaspirillum sp.]|jgi:chemotaxis protein CheZ|nr:chemotaxis protein CheZ [Herbaspirillum sp.]